jgi:hypothetical protein
MGIFGDATVACGGALSFVEAILVLAQSFASVEYPAVPAQSY